MAATRSTHGWTGRSLAALLLVSACTSAPRHAGVDVAAQYVRCAERLGFDAGTVQLTVDSDGTPLSFSSEMDVPGEVHGPCFALLTDVPVSGVSSHGAERDVDDATLAANTYEVCVWSKWFDVGGAQAVFIDGADVPTFMKTGAEVPAAIHGPCFSALTGMPANGQSSWSR